MAKTLLDFEGKLIDVFNIKDIEKIDEWDDIKKEIVHRIYFNRGLAELQYAKVYTFEYVSVQFRDDRFDELKLRLENIEHVAII